MNELQMIGHYDAKISYCTMQKGSIDLVKLNFNFEHELLSKHFGLDLNLVQEIAGPERWGLEKDRMISSIQNDKRKRRKADKEKEGKLVKENAGTPRTVLS